MRRSETEAQFVFSLAFDGPGLKTYRFAAVDHQTQESWVKALLSASHCYMSLLVRDLGRQYEGLLFVQLLFFFLYNSIRLMKRSFIFILFRTILIYAFIP